MTDLQNHARLIEADIRCWTGFINKWADQKAEGAEDWADIGDLKYVLNVLSLLESFIGDKPIMISSLYPFRDVESRAKKSAL